MTNHLKNGNSKLHNRLIFDLPTGRTCLNSGSCHKTCYARKAERRFKVVLASRIRNLELSTDPVTFEKTIHDELNNAKQKFVRIHSSGDFYSQEYINSWGRIMKKTPHIQFYAYTKVKHLFKWPALKNFNLIDSMIKGQLNYGTKEYVTKLNKKHGTFLCPATMTKHEGKVCGNTCTYCMYHNNVAFLQH